ncbi:hypothetical protein JST97_18540 [bacterium]|nr:hypothetical protein [bacterium]
MRDQQLLKMHEAVTGQSLRPESDPQVLWEFVSAQSEGVLLTLHWFAGQTDFHSLTLNEVRDGRMHFHNPIQEHSDLEPGSVIRDDAPERIYHAPGDESVSRDEFDSWFGPREALGYLSR